MTRVSPQMLGGRVFHVVTLDQLTQYAFVPVNGFDSLEAIMPLDSPPQILYDLDAGLPFLNHPLT